MPQSLQVSDRQEAPARSTTQIAKTGDLPSLSQNKYRQTFNMSHTKSQNLNVSRLVL